MFVNLCPGHKLEKPLYHRFIIFLTFQLHYYQLKARICFQPQNVDTRSCVHHMA